MWLFLAPAGRHGSRRGSWWLGMVGLAACSGARWVVLDPAAVPESRRQQRAGLEAAQSGDEAAYLSHFRIAAALRPGYPSLAYQLARAYALADSTDRALEQLRLVARMGVGGDPADDSAFAGLAESPAFGRIREMFRRNATPAVRSAARFTAGDEDFLAEGIAYDPRQGDFFLGSVHWGTILRIHGESVDTFATRPAGTWGMMGMTVDAGRGVLWVASTAAREVAGIDTADIGRAALLGFDLHDGRLTVRVEAPADGGVHWFGDVCLTPGGTVYVSDSRRPAVYRLSADEARLDPVVVGAPLQSPQGIAALAPDQVYLADYALGIVRIDTAGTIVPLPFPEHGDVLGIDGLYAWKGSLIGIQNGFSPLRVIRLRLGRHGGRIERVEVLESNHPLYPEPTLGTVVGDTLFYIGNAQWSRFETGVPLGEGKRAIVLGLGLR